MSRTPERALIWCMVTICPTLSLPYLSVTYWITSSRRFMQKSMSKSGMLTRSGFNTTQAVECIRQEITGSAEVDELLEFIAASQRGFIK